MMPVMALEDRKALASFMVVFNLHDFDSKTQILLVTKAKATLKIQLNALEIKTEREKRLTNRVYNTQFTNVVNIPKKI